MPVNDTVPGQYVNHFFSFWPVSRSALDASAIIFLIAAFLFIPMLFYLMLGSEGFKARFIGRGNGYNLFWLVISAYFFLQLAGLVLRIYLTIYSMPIMIRW